jgi:tRNA1(Val) A37 N6-methylase TrmN6
LSKGAFAGTFSPMAPKATIQDPVLGPLTDDWLTRDVRVYQRQKGHRFSSDDVVTAYVAHRAAPDARRVLDLGCGLGSVLLQLAWKLPEARLAGVEVQPVSFELLRRNVARSGYAGRVVIEHGDLRDNSVLDRVGAGFDLITGTPPYFPPDAALDADDEQRALARVEYRGGIEAYIGAAMPRLSSAGVLVLCGDARALQRTTAACHRVGLCVHGRCDVVARAGRPPLFSVWTLRRAVADCHVETLVLRDAAGGPTSDRALLRQFAGIGEMSS